MKNTVLSAIIPIYNAEKTIEKCLGSVLNQTLADIELVLVDDCSTDNTIKLIEEILSKQQCRYKLIKNEINRGQSQCRKIGLSHSSGRYISFIDSDDWIEPNMYERMYDEAIKTNADIVTCDYYVESKDGISIWNNNCLDLIDGILTYKIAGSLWNKIFKRSLFEEDIKWPKLNMGEDGAINIQLILKAKSIKHISKPLYHYYINPNSTINRRGKEDYLKRSIGLKESSDIIFDNIHKNDLQDKYEEAILFRKVYVNILASAMVTDTKFYKAIINLYPELSIEKVLFSQLPYSIKLRYLLFRTRLYPYLYKLKNLHSYISNNET